MKVRNKYGYFEPGMEKSVSEAALCKLDGRRADNDILDDVRSTSDNTAEMLAALVGVLAEKEILNASDIEKLLPGYEVAP